MGSGEDMEGEDAKKLEEEARVRLMLPGRRVRPAGGSTARAAE